MTGAERKRKWRARRRAKLLAAEATSPLAPYAHLFRNLRPLTPEDAEKVWPLRASRGKGPTKSLRWHQDRIVST